MPSNETEVTMSSPNLRKDVPQEVPSTPTSRTRRRMAALSPSSGTSQLVPVSPGLKRSNSGSLKSPDYRLNTKDVMSPGLLSTPRNSGYNSNDDEKSTPRRKQSRNPLFFSPKTRIGDENVPHKEDLSVISSQLKDKLSLALGSVQRKERHSASPSRLNFTDIWHANSVDSPTRRKGSIAQSPPRNLQAASINLQTLQQLPCMFSNSPRHVQTSSFGLQQSANFSCEQPLRLPSPDETSAHSALLEAFSRLKKGQQCDRNEHLNPFGITTPPLAALQTLPFEVLESKPKAVPNTIPSISVAVPLKPKDESEQDAVLSLMSLASPQGLKKLVHSFNRPLGDLTALSRSSSAGVSVLPPINGLIHKVDDDETDVEEVSSSDQE